MNTLETLTVTLVKKPHIQIVTLLNIIVCTSLRVLPCAILGAEEAAAEVEAAAAPPVPA